MARRTGVPWNESDYANPKFDELLTKAEGIIDLGERKKVVKELELIMQPNVALELRGGFSLTLGPFAASVDRVGVSFALIVKNVARSERPGDSHRYSCNTGRSASCRPGFRFDGNHSAIAAAPRATAEPALCATTTTRRPGSRAWGCRATTG